MHLHSSTRAKVKRFPSFLLFAFSRGVQFDKRRGRREIGRGEREREREREIEAKKRAEKGKWTRKTSGVQNPLCCRVCLLKSINLRICTGCPVKLDSVPVETILLSAVFVIPF